MNTKCDQCGGFLKHKIKTGDNGTIIRNGDGTPIFEPFGNNTTKYGGLLCSTGCAISFIQKYEILEQYNLDTPWLNN
jgi:hypothetical protein